MRREDLEGIAGLLLYLFTGAVLVSIPILVFGDIVAAVVVGIALGAVASLLAIAITAWILRQVRRLSGKVARKRQ